MFVYMTKEVYFHVSSNCVAHLILYKILFYTSLHGLMSMIFGVECAKFTSYVVIH